MYDIIKKKTTNQWKNESETGGSISAGEEEATREYRFIIARKAKKFQRVMWMMIITVCISSSYSA